jgi:hypothetical protein
LDRKSGLAEGIFPSQKITIQLNVGGSTTEVVLISADFITSTFTLFLTTKLCIDLLGNIGNSVF